MRRQCGHVETRALPVRGPEKDLADELTFHLQSHADSLERQGVAPEEARRRARLELGNPERVKEEVRDMRLGALYEQLGQDLRHGLRLLRRDAGLSLGIVLILALGLATAIRSFADKSLLRPLPCRHPQRPRGGRPVDGGAACAGHRS